MAKNTVAIWCLTVPLTALFLLAGATKFGTEATTNFQKFGFSDEFRIFIGIAELAGAIGLLVPRLSTWAAAGLVLIMGGAVYTHIAQGISIAVPAIVGVLLAGLAFLRRGDALFLSAAGDTASGATRQRPAA